MRIKSNVFLAVWCLMLALLVGIASARAQGVMSLANTATIALKSGESTEVGNLYWVEGCRSMLKSPPEVEILEGPPQVSAAVKEAMVLPRAQNCSKPVHGGVLVLSAKEIEDSSFSRLTVRVIYKTRDGDRTRSVVFNLQLIP
jgi:hypothetical protein